MKYWEYAEYTKIAKEFGGPKEFLKEFYSAAFKDGSIDMLKNTLVTSLIIVATGGAVFGISALVRKNRKTSKIKETAVIEKAEKQYNIVAQDRKNNSNGYEDSESVSLNDQVQYKALSQILDEMESVGNKAKEIKDGLYCEYAPAIEKLTDTLNEALKTKTEGSKQELSRIALRAHDVQCEIYKDLKLKLEYGKNRFEDMKDSPEYRQNAVDALRLLAFMTLAYQIACRCFAEQGEYGVCNNILQGYKEIVGKSGKDQQDILLWLNLKNVFIEQGDLVYGFKQVMQKIAEYNKAE